MIRSVLRTVGLTLLVYLLLVSGCATTRRAAPASSAQSACPVGYIVTDGCGDDVCPVGLPCCRIFFNPRGDAEFDCDDCICTGVPDPM